MRLGELPAETSIVDCQLSGVVLIAPHQLIHWPLMGDLLRLVQCEGDWVERLLFLYVERNVTANEPIILLFYSEPLLQAIVCQLQR